MSRVRKTTQQAKNAIAKAAVDQRPTATQCECGTWRTPGVAHKAGDTESVAKGLISEWCTK